MAFLDQKHGLTPLEKCDFWDFKKVFFYSQKRFFSSTQLLRGVISSLILTKSKWRKNLAFFVQKHGFTPLKKCDFLDLKKFGFLRPKKVFFFSSKSKSISSSLILIKSKSRRKLHFFWQGYGLTPLKKWDFLEFEKFCFFKVKKDFFFLCKVTKHYF